MLDRRAEAAPRVMPDCASGCSIGEADIRAWRIEVLDDLASAEKWWRDGDPFAHYVFQCHGWLLAWQETLGRAQGLRPCIVRVADATGRTLLLLPLGIRRIFAWRVLMFLGHGVSDYNAPLVAPALRGGLNDAVMARLWRDILARLPRVDVVWLSQMPEHVEGIRNPLLGLTDVVPSGSAGYAASPLPGSFAAFRDAHKSQIFSTTERKRRKTVKLGQGEVRFEVLAVPGDIDEAVDFAISRKRQRYGDASLPSEYQAFYRRMVHAALGGGEPHVCRLRVGEVTVAAHIGAAHRGRFYFLLPGFEGGEWASLSPGNQLTIEMIRWCIANGIETFDMTVGDEEYKRFFTDTRLPLYLCRYAVSAKGRFMLVLVSAFRRFQQMRAARARPKAPSAPTEPPGVAQSS